METQNIEINKEDNSTELQLKSDKNINYEISIYYKDDKLYFKGISKDKSQNKKYENNYILKELVKTNSFFLVHKNIKEVYEELDFIVKKYKDSNNIKLLEKIDKLIIIFPINTLKIKECQFEMNEIIPNKDKENIMTILKEMQDKFSEENNLLKKQINEIKEENKKLNEQIYKNEMLIQYGEYWGDFAWIKDHYMHQLSGPRSVSAQIHFSKTYKKKPNVIISINAIDVDSTDNLRINAFPINIDTWGFCIKIETWGNTKIYKVKISWTSFGY